MGHIELARWAGQVLIAPASADLLARLAHGAGRRPAHDPVPGHRGAGRGRAGDEPADVGAPGDAGQRASACARAVSRSWAPAAAARPAASPGPGACWKPPRLVAALADAARAGAARRASGAGQRRADLRGHRSGALHRQPQFRPHGLRRGRGRARAGAEVTLVAGPGHTWPRRPACGASTCAARAQMHEAVLAHAMPPMSTSPRRRWPTIARPNRRRSKIKKSGQPRVRWNWCPTADILADWRQRAAAPARWSASPPRPRTCCAMRAASSCARAST